MRQDGVKPLNSNAIGMLLAIACVSSAATGCQLTMPAALQPARNATRKPPAGATTTSARSGSMPASARIRGQSPSGWNPAASPISDPNRLPLSATDATAAQPINRYSYPVGQPTSLPATPSNTQATGTPPGYAPATAGVPGVTQQPGYGIGQLPPPTTVYQPQTSPLTGPGYGTPGGGVPGAVAAPNSYGSTIAPGATGLPSDNPSAIAPGVFPPMDPTAGFTAPGVGPDVPRERIAPIDVFLQEGRTGRVIVGGSVNSDLGVAGQLIIDERNFNIRRWTGGWGRAFRGGGQSFRAEIMPGNRVERYTVSWSERNLLGYLPYSLSVGGFLFTRQFRDWTEQRLGGRVALGYEVTKDLSVSTEIRLEDVKLFDPRLSGVAELDDALGSNDIYTARLRLARDTRDSPFMATQGSLLELVYDQVFGEYDYPRGRINYSRYFMVRERADQTGRHTIASTWRLGLSGSQTPVFDNFFAGGYSTLRGFSFRGASPKVGDVQVGGELMFLGSLEYVFPLTADEMLRGVAFVDYGTIERDIEFNSENFRVAPGLGLRIAVPALGAAPLAFDFAYPINHADSDDRQLLSFFMGFTR